MKKSILLYIIIIVGFTSCTGVLETPPTSNPSEEVLWQTKVDFELALAGCYSALQYYTFSWQSPAYDAMTDNAYCNETSSSCFSVGYIQQGKITADMTGLVPDLYKHAYRVIASCNLFLQKLAEFDDPNEISDAYHRQLAGEVTFLRCYAYYMLYLHYGEVPIVTEPLDLDTQYQPKSTLEQVYSQIYNDLVMCVDYLPEQTYKQAGGRVSKGAARGLLARMLMFNAYGDNGTVSNSSLVQEAYDQLDKITGYSLNNRYAYNFRTEEQEASPEIIFSIKYQGSNFHDMNYRYGTYAILKAVDNLANEYEEGDLRKDEIMRHTSHGTYYWPGGTEVEATASSNIAWYYQKYLDPIYTVADTWTQSTRSEQDIVILRWGELMLLKAEAANELNNVNEALDLINEVRDRAGLNPVSTTSQSELREIIRKERRVETPFEGIRIYDMKRWRIMSKLNGLIIDSTLPNYKVVWEEKFFYLPLPQSEIEKAAGILKQNPNYL